MRPSKKHISLFTVPDGFLKDIETVSNLDKTTTNDLFSEFLSNIDPREIGSTKLHDTLKDIAKHSSQAAYAELLQQTVKLTLVESNVRLIAKALGVKYEYAVLLVRAAKKVITNTITADDLHNHVGKSVAITDMVLADLAKEYSTKKNLKEKIGLASAISDTVKTKDKLVSTVSKLGLGSSREESQDKKVLNDIRNSFANLLNLDDED